MNSEIVIAIVICGGLISSVCIYIELLLLQLFQQILKLW